MIIPNIWNNKRCSKPPTSKDWHSGKLAIPEMDIATSVQCSNYLHHIIIHDVSNTFQLEIYPTKVPVIAVIKQLLINYPLVN